MSLMTRKEIAARWRITVDTLRKNYETRPTYPKPAQKLSQKTVFWELADVVRFERSCR